LTGSLLLALALPALLWQDPGNVASVDFTRPAGNVPRPAEPLTYLAEPGQGTSAKVMVRDAHGIDWQVKGGPEARAEAFVSRFVSALGYFAESILFIAKGKIEGIPGLHRASGFIGEDGSFTWAGFERRDPGARFRPDLTWRWSDNPFLKTREFNGLRILMMLVSNWDNKDGMDRRGANTGVLEVGGRNVYFVTDWGQSMGAWGGWRFFGRSNWNCADYSRQTDDFVRQFPDGTLRFGYAGQHTDGFRDGITAEDVRWLMQYLGRITDAQIRVGLLEAGASVQEQDCFATALRSRIEQLRRIAVPRSAIR
jgi:hypothetical protein